MSTPIRPDTSNGAAYAPDAAMPPKPEKTSLVEDFIDIFYTPSSVYVRRATSGFWGPLLVVAVISALFAFANRGVMSQIFDVEYQRNIAKVVAENPRLTPDMLASQKAIMEKVTGFMGYVGTPILMFVIAVFVWLAAKLVQAKMTYGQAVLIIAFAWVPRLVQGLFTTVQMLLFDTANITSMHSLGFSPARFMDPDTTSKQIMAIAGRFDLFTLWVTVLIGIGVAVIGKVPRSRGYIAAAIVFVLGTIPMLFA